MKNLMVRLMVLLVCVAAPASATLLTNPGFESPILADGEWHIAAPTGWFYTGDGNGWHTNPSVWVNGWEISYEGDNIAQLPPVHHLNQDISVPALTAGQQYTLTMQVHETPGYDDAHGSTASWAIAYLGWDGWAGWVDTGWVNFDDSDGWVEMSVTLDTDVMLAAIGATQFNIQLDPDGGAPIVVDAASLTVIPEPATMCLLGLGGLLLRRRR